MVVGAVNGCCIFGNGKGNDGLLFSAMEGGDGENYLCCFFLMC